jgi:hypothetical protein
MKILICFLFALINYVNANVILECVVEDSCVHEYELGFCLDQIQIITDNDGTNFVVEKVHPEGLSLFLPPTIIPYTGFSNSISEYSYQLEPLDRDQIDWSGELKIKNKKFDMFCALAQ